MPGGMQPQQPGMGMNPMMGMGTGMNPMMGGMNPMMGMQPGMCMQQTAMEMQGAAPPSAKASSRGREEPTPSSRTSGARSRGRQLAPRPSSARSRSGSSTPQRKKHKDDRQGVSASFEALGLEWKHGARATSQVSRCSLINACDNRKFPMMKITSFEEEAVDMFGRSSARGWGRTLDRRTSTARQKAMCATLAGSSTSKSWHRHQAD